MKQIEKRTGMPVETQAEIPVFTTREEILKAYKTYAKGSYYFLIDGKQYFVEFCSKIPGEIGSGLVIRYEDIADENDEGIWRTVPIISIRQEDEDGNSISFLSFQEDPTTIITLKLQGGIEFVIDENGILAGAKVHMISAGPHSPYVEDEIGVTFYNGEGWRNISHLNAEKELVRPDAHARTFFPENTLIYNYQRGPNHIQIFNIRGTKWQITSEIDGKKRGLILDTSRRLNVPALKELRTLPIENLSELLERYLPSTEITN